MKYYKYDINGTRIELFVTNTLETIKKAVEQIIFTYEKKLPQDRNAKIVLKPNLNNDLNALTGCTTDLRIIVAVIESLQKRNYTNITIGDGPNCGALHEKINVHERLGVTAIGKQYGVNVVDFNVDQAVHKKLGKRETKIAKTFAEADFIINLPKIKTHTEAKYSGAMKNLVGINVGYEKRNVHWNLQKFIVELNNIIKPNLNIMDGLIAMEGDGPGAGTPKRLGIILASENSFLLDLFTSMLVGFKIGEVPYLVIAKEKGYISKEEILTLKKLNIIGMYPIKKPSHRPLVNFVLTNYFVLPRYWKMFDPLFNTKIMNWFLVNMHIRQDLYASTEKNLILKKNGDVKDLEEYCPMSLPINNEEFEFDNKCVQCMYCYITGKGRIRVEGELGYMKDQMKRYEKSFEKEF